MACECENCECNKLTDEIVDLEDQLNDAESQIEYLEREVQSLEEELALSMKDDTLHALLEFYRAYKRNEDLTKANLTVEFALASEDILL